ncbi:vWA domain-containing protein [Mogibacterium diversum]
MSKSFNNENNDRESNKDVILAEKIITAAQDKIVASMRFMDSAVFALKKEIVTDKKGIFMVDGTTLYYSSDEIFARMKRGLSSFTHDYMHVLLHCIFKHYYVSEKVNRLYWDLASDIAVEEMIESLGATCLNTPESSERRDELKKIKAKRGRLSVDRLYKSFVNDPPIEAEVGLMRELFAVDDHLLWYRANKNVNKPVDTSEIIEDGEADNSHLQDHDKNQQRSSDDDTDTKFDITSIEELGNNEECDGAALLSDQDWDKIRETVKTSLEMDDASFGDVGGTMKRELRYAEEKRIDYSTFLRKFAANHETLKVDDDSFDYIMYTYGLNRYRDMPLIEPLEYKDEKNIRDLVIAIDTSGSTDGELVKKFVDKSFEILCNNDVIGAKFNIHVVQCDAEIQDDTVLKNRDDVDGFLRSLEIKGLGGTDFRPVFHYINELIRKKELRNLRGLLYFTDGKGTYPKRKPMYDTAFIFVDDDAFIDDVPAWAMKVYFDE